VNNALIGYTGFVGSNIYRQANFNQVYNSKNIIEIGGKEFDIIVCAGVSAIKWLANKNPHKDLEEINRLISHLDKVTAKKFVLISTIDVYDKALNVDESTIPETTEQDNYGRNRYYLENWVKNKFENHLIVRLPALFGEGLKKNFIYDLITLIPSIITSEKWDDLKKNINEEEFILVEKSYAIDENGNFKFKDSTEKDKRQIVKKIIEKYNFTSLIFTDERSKFPYYNLDNIWNDIERALKRDLKIINLSVEPISCKEIVRYCLNKNFDNIIEFKKPLDYDMKTVHYKVFGGNTGYIYDRHYTLDALKNFIDHKISEDINI
jgi:nucleoside-diphosphate-sugar epimerase